MYRDDNVRLRHMLDAARQALQFAQGRTRADLDRDLMLVFSLVKAIEIIGEAASQVSEIGRENVSDIPWADIIGMRNRLVHAYYDINREILWQTVRRDLPPLVATLEHVLSGEG